MSTHYCLKSFGFCRRNILKHPESCPDTKLTTVTGDDINQVLEMVLTLDQSWIVGVIVGDGFGDGFEFGVRDHFITFQ